MADLLCPKNRLTGPTLLNNLDNCDRLNGTEVAT